MQSWFSYQLVCFFADSSESWTNTLILLSAQYHFQSAAQTLWPQAVGGWLTCFHERVKVTSWAGAQGRYGYPARALCTRSRRRRDRSGRARRRAGPRCSAAHCTSPGIQAPGTRLYWGPISLLQKAKGGCDCVFLKQTSISWDVIYKINVRVVLYTNTSNTIWLSTISAISNTSGLT